MVKQLKFPNNGLLIAIIITAILFGVAFASTVTVSAAPQHSFGTGQGRYGTITENDHHTPEWARFSFNYQFTSGSDHRFELGRPTTFNGVMPIDPHSVNMRRDAQVSLVPPSYGIFSGVIATAPANRLFPQPVNPHFHQPNHWHDSNLIPAFDTLQQGVNAPSLGNPMNVQTSAGDGGFLPPTSIGT